MGGKGLFDGTVIIGLAADAHSGLSDGFLKASLAAVIDQRGGRLQKWREGRMRRREGRRVHRY